MMISFRLSGNDLTWLENQQIETDLNQAGELSLAVTAKRILLSFQNKTDNTTEDTSEVTPKIIQEIEERLEKKLDERFEEMYCNIMDNLNYTLDTRLASLEKSVTATSQETKATEDTSEVTTDNTSKEVTEDTTEDSSEVTYNDATEDNSEGSTEVSRDDVVWGLRNVNVTSKQMIQCLKNNNITIGRDRSREALIGLIEDNQLWKECYVTRT